MTLPAYLSLFFNQNDMKIAWQYKKYLGDGESGPTELGASNARLPVFCHSFDLNKSIDPVKLEGAKISYSNLSKNADTNPTAEGKFKTIYSELNFLVNQSNMCVYFYITIPTSSILH